MGMRVMAKAVRRAVSGSPVLPEIPRLAWSCRARGDRKPAFPAPHSYPVARGKAGTDQLSHSALGLNSRNTSR